MMLPVLSPEYFGYHYMQKLAVVRVYRQCSLSRTTAKSLVSYLRLSTIYSDDSSVLHVMVQSGRTISQVTSFELPPR